MGDYEKPPTDYRLMDAPENDSLWELLSVYADGEANPAEAAQVESLLRSDAAMKREFDFMRLASSFVAAEPERMPPSELRDRIFAATVARPTLRRRLTTVWTNFAGSLTPRYALAGGLVGVALLTVALWPHNHQAVINAPQVAKTQVDAKQLADATRPLTQVRPTIEPTITKTTQTTPTDALLKAAEKTSAKPTVTAPTAKKPQEIADVHPLAKAAPTVIHAKPVASKHPKTVKTPQKPAPVTPDDTVIAEVAYSPKPDMDRNNQRPASVVSVPDANSSAPDDQSGETGAPSKPVTIALANTPQRPQRYEGHLIAPPDNARQMTPSAMRQQQHAHNAGYNELAISSIRQNQIRLGTELRF